MEDVIKKILTGDINKFLSDPAVIEAAGFKNKEEMDNFLKNKV